eukprot:TRINITY_DN940_c0_g2_i1.p1 TRINITY_DN940_c0_g2~~TRINITY_DN940_c0_g2_i1.p1  ORF type:complete len:730 (-),score=130.13 TRINITY_DN940_c0_g2_i1:74-2263(-)
MKSKSTTSRKQSGESRFGKLRHADLSSWTSSPSKVVAAPNWQIGHCASDSLPSHLKIDSTDIGLDQTVVENDQDDCFLQIKTPIIAMDWCVNQIDLDSGNPSPLLAVGTMIHAFHCAGATCEGSCCIQLWEVSKKAIGMCIAEDHGCVLTLRYLPGTNESNLLAASFGDGTVNVYSLPRQLIRDSPSSVPVRLAPVASIASLGPIRVLEWRCSDASLLVGTHTGDIIHLALTTSGTLTVKMRINACPGIIRSLSLNQSNDMLACTSTDQYLRVWDLAKPWHPVAEFPMKRCGYTSRWVNDTLVACGLDDGMIVFVDLLDGQTITQYVGNGCVGAVMCIDTDESSGGLGVCTDDGFAAAFAFNGYSFADVESHGRMEGAVLHRLIMNSEKDELQVESALGAPHALTAFPLAQHLYSIAIVGAGESGAYVACAGPAGLVRIRYSQELPSCTVTSRQAKRRPMSSVYGAMSKQPEARESGVKTFAATPVADDQPQQATIKKKKKKPAKEPLPDEPPRKKGRPKGAKDSKKRAAWGSKKGYVPHSGLDDDDAESDAAEDDDNAGGEAPQQKKVSKRQPKMAKLIVLASSDSEPPSTTPPPPPVLSHAVLTRVDGTQKRDGRGRPPKPKPQPPTDDAEAVSKPATTKSTKVAAAAEAAPTQKTPPKAKAAPAKESKGVLLKKDGTVKKGGRGRPPKVVPKDSTAAKGAAKKPAAKKKRARSPEQQADSDDDDFQ